MSSNGAVIENLSNRKFLWIIGGLTITQILFFVLGGIYAPEPASNMPFLMNTCEDRDVGKRDKWFFIRPGGHCNLVDIEDQRKPYQPQNDSMGLVFVAQMPHVRDSIQLEYSPWFQWLLAVLSVRTQYLNGSPIDANSEIHLEVRMGYRTHDDREDEWHELVSTTVSRPLKCSIEKLVNYNDYDCDPSEFFELGSNDYPFYLLNVRLPTCDMRLPLHKRRNCNIGKFTGLEMVAIHQNGGFTRLWLALKTLLSPIVLSALFWYWNRIRLLNRPPYLVERAILWLAVALALVDLPVEWLSLCFRMPYLLLLGDIRQGIFYAMLLSFWLIFTGEHLVTDRGKNRLDRYWRHLAFVVVSCVCLLVFDMCERGVHLKNPFYSIWATRFGSTLAYTFIIVAIVSTLLYLVFLIYKLGQVVLTIRRMQATVSQLHKNRRLKFQVIIWRFQGLMILTFVCAVCTVLSYIVKQYGEGELYSGGVELEEVAAARLSYTSAFFTGTFGLWNVYVLLLLAMYAPSHKRYPLQAASQVGLTSGSNDGEEEEEEDIFEMDTKDSTVLPSTSRRVEVRQSTEGSAFSAFMKATNDE